MNLIIPGGPVQLSGNPIWIRHTGIVIKGTSYQACVRITCHDGKVEIAAISPGTYGDTWFNVAGYIDRPTILPIEWPCIGAVAENPQAAWNVILECGETYIDDNGNRVLFFEAATETIRVLKGGISDFKQAGYNDAATTFYDEWILKGKFLTNQPNNQVVSADQIVKLYYLSPYAETVYAHYKCRVTHQPVEGVTVTDLTAVATLVPESGLIEFSISPVWLGLNPNIKPISYEFWLYDETTDISEKRNYIVDPDYHENLNYLIVANSLSGGDVIRLTGAVKKSVDISGAEGYQPMAIDASSGTGSIVVTSRSARRKWTINTGFKSAPEMEALIDVYLSKNVWLIIDGKRIPVILANGDKLLTDTMSDLHDVDLELLEAHDLRFG